ncbi:unnamed protein product [Rhodiola kirilowii]
MDESVVVPSFIIYTFSGHTTTATSHPPLRRFQFPHAPSPLTTLDTSPDLNSSIARHGCWTCI